VGTRVGGEKEQEEGQVEIREGQPCARRRGEQEDLREREKRGQSV
jgi:hypothetical protein